MCQIALVGIDKMEKSLTYTTERFMVLKTLKDLGGFSLYIFGLILFSVSYIAIPVWLANIFPWLWLIYIFLYLTSPSIRENVNFSIIIICFLIFFFISAILLIAFIIWIFPTLRHIFLGHP